MLSTMTMPSSDRRAHRAELPAPYQLPALETLPDTVQRLLEAGADAFSDNGFHATTTRDIASRAGLSPAGVYVHFASKEDLLFAISERGHLAARDLLFEAAREAATPTEGLRAIMALFSRWHAEQWRVGRIVQYEFGNLTRAHRETVLTLRKQIDSVVRDVLSAGVESGDFDVPDVHSAALALMSMCVDVARWYQPGIRRTPAQIGDDNAELGLRLVASRTPAG